MLKFNFFDLEVDYLSLKKKFYTFYSNFYFFKKKLIRKYRRRKSFKRLVYRNNLGRKISFNRIQFFDKKKKKK